MNRAQQQSKRRLSEHLPKKRVMITISIVPEGAITCSLLGRHYDYKADLDFYIEAFRRETHTPNAAIFKQDNMGGYVSLVLPPEYGGTTEEQNTWAFHYGDVTGFDSDLYSEEELAVLFQKEVEACDSSD